MASLQNRSLHYSEKFLPLLGMLVISAQLAAHVLGPRTITLGNLVLPGGIWSFPITFFLWDIITEVYGFQQAKKIIFYYVFCQLFFAFLVWSTLKFPVDATLENANHFSLTLGSVPKITIAMIIAVFCGDYVNCLILQKIKIYTKGNHLWFRLIGATAIGEAVTSIVWVTVFYWHKSAHPNLFSLISSQYLVKVLFEVFAIPFTYVIISVLKKYELCNSTRKYLNFDPETLKVYTTK